MDSPMLQDRLIPLVKQYKLPFILGIVGLMLIVYGLISLSNTQKTGDELIFEPGEKSQESVKNNQLVVDIEGAVVKPGMYRLRPDSRLHDALVVAGGLSEQADRDWIAKNVNLAAKLNDGVKLYLPLQGEKTTGGSLSSSPPPVIQSSLGADGVLASQNGLININTATERELDTLSGIGPVTAQKIINARPYGKIEEMLEKKVVSSKVFENIKTKITAY